MFGPTRPSSGVLKLVGELLHITSTHGMQQAHHHNNTTHAAREKGKPNGFNFGMNCKGGKHINSDLDSLRRCCSSPNQF
jgi:hypothetical protein